MYCTNCGAEIDENAYICIHCGALVVRRKPKITNGMAVAGFVCSFLIPLLGWIFGGIGLSRSKKLPGEKGKTLSSWAIFIATGVFILNWIIQLS